MKPVNAILVTKRDGAIERFEFTKLRNCLARAMRACSYDPRLAEPLTRAVAAHLREWVDPGLPSTDYVFRCVRTVLLQTDLAPVARSLSDHRRTRAARRKHLRVVAAGGKAGKTVAWRKGELVGALVRNFGLLPSVARFLAGRVEQIVLDMNVRLVTRENLAELVRLEAQAWGLVDFVPADAESDPVAGPPPTQDF